MTEEQKSSRTKKKKIQLPPSGLKLVEHARTCYAITVPEGTVLQDVLKPSFWQHNAQRMKVLDRIEVVCEDLTWCADLIVTHVADLTVKVKKLNYVALTKSGEKKGDVSQMELAKDQREVGETDTIKFKIQHIPGKGFCVRRAENGSPWIGDGHATRKAAENWIEEHRKTMRR